MGHVRLGVLPRTKAWKEVVGLIAAGADVSQVANATITAAEKAFSFVMDDKGYTEAVWLMTQLAIAAKKDDPYAHLRSVGVYLPDDATLPDVTAVVCGYALGVADRANSGLEHDDIEEGFQVSTGVPLGDAGVVVDRKAVEQYQARYKLLCTEKAEAEADGDHQRVEEIEDELAQIFGAISGGTAKGGKLRKAGDKRKNVRDAFRNSVNRAITAIGKYDKPLAEHLKASIKHGNEVVYRPEMSIPWDVRPIVNS